MKEAEIIRMYELCGSIRQVSAEMGISRSTIRRILITHGINLDKCPRAAAITAMQGRGMDVQQIADALEITPKTVRAYLPYTKGTYIGEKSANAQRIAACRARKKENG